MDTNADRPGSPPGWRRTLAAVVLVGLLARGAFLVQALRAGRLADPDRYLVLARSLAAGRGLAVDGRLTAYRPPFYPLVLAPIVGFMGDRADLGVAALHLALGAGTVLLTATAARRWGLSPSAALAAALVAACDPVLVSQSRVVMTESLAGFLTAAALAALAGPGPAAAARGGVALGLASLCRPSALPAAGLTAVAALIARPGSARARVVRAAALAGAVLATLAPWAARNAVALGEPVWTTTHGGYTLYLANNPVYYDEVVRGAPGAVWGGPNQARWFASIAVLTRGLDEPGSDRRLRSEALAVIRARPRDFLRASAARLGRFWGVAPAGAVYPGWLRIASAVWTVPLWVALAAGLTRPENWAWPRVAAPLSLVALSLVHTVYWTDLRMRSPVVPAVALVAASALPRGPSRPPGGAEDGPPSPGKK